MTANDYNLMYLNSVLIMSGSIRVWKDICICACDCLLKWKEKSQVSELVFAYLLRRG